MIFLFLSVLLASCHKNSHSSRDSQRIEIQNLLKEATRQKDTLMNVQLADSLVDLALGKALKKEDSLMIVSCYIGSLKNKNTDHTTLDKGKFFLTQALGYSDKINNPNLVTAAYFQMCEFLLEKNQPDEAAVILGMASNTQGEKKKNQIGKLLLQSKISEQKNQSFEQLKSLLDAQYMATDMENDSLQFITLQMLSDFYFREGNYEKSLDYSQKIKEMLQHKKPVDSVKWYYAEANRLSIFVKNMDNKVVYQIAEKINLFGKKTHNPKLCSYAQSAIRSYFIDNKQFNELKRWYAKYPAELKLLQQNKPQLFYRIKAYIAEQNGKVDSATGYFDKAGLYVEQENPYSLYNYYLRKSELQERNHFEEQAEKDLETAFYHSQKTKLYDEQIQLGNKIVSYYDKKGNQQQANHFLRTLNTANAHYIESLNNENIRKIELNTIFAHKQLEHDKLIEKANRERNMQYMIITIAIVFLIMTIVTLSFYNLPKWWLKSMSFVSFILLFEFIILLIDHQLHEWTHGNPYQILAVKVLIIPLLLPVHHWLEKKFVSTLLHGDISLFFKKMKSRIFPVKKDLHTGE